MTSYYLYISALFFLLTGCKKIVNRPIEYVQNDGIVIQAQLTNDTSYQEIYISETDDRTGDIILGISKAKVIVLQRNLSILGDTLAPDTISFYELRPGVYATDSFNNYLDNAIYTLQVVIDSDTFEATDDPRRLQSTEGIQTVNTIFYPEQDMHLMQDLYIELDTTPLFIKMFLDWSNLPGYDTLPYEENHAESINYRFTTIDAHQLFGASAYYEQIIVPSGTHYIIESYSVSQSYQNFLRGIAAETKWRGGMFDLQAGNAPTNLTNGAFGFFAVGERLTISGTLP